MEKSREEVLGRERGGIGQKDFMGALIKDLEYQEGCFHKSLNSVETRLKIIV